MAQGYWSRVTFLVVLFSTLASCGGANQPVKSRPGAPVARVAEESPKAAPKKSGPDCSDGTCIACGDAACPKGFFCDESTSKPTCQWVPTCSQACTCSCVERVLSGECTCTERDGGAYLRCTQ
jgi:hypothetical protein